MDYEKLYNAYYMQVYSFVVYLSKNRELAEEITQNTFFKALSTSAKYNGQSDELTWLCSIAKNLYFDELKKNKKHADINRIEDLPSDKSIEHSLCDSDSAFRIHTVLHNLEEPYKEVFQLRVFGELPFSQIALIFSKSESWARVTYHRAKIKIQERMKQEYGDQM